VPFGFTYYLVTVADCGPISPAKRHLFIGDMRLPAPLYMALQARPAALPGRAKILLASGGPVPIQ